MNHCTHRACPCNRCCQCCKWALLHISSKFCRNWGHVDNIRNNLACASTCALARWDTKTKFRRFKRVMVSSFWLERFLRSDACSFYKTLLSSSASEGILTNMFARLILIRVIDCLLFEVWGATTKAYHFLSHCDTSDGSTPYIVN